MSHHHSDKRGVGVLRGSYNASFPLRYIYRDYYRIYKKGGLKYVQC